MGAGGAPEIAGAEQRTGAASDRVYGDVVGCRAGAPGDARADDRDAGHENRTDGGLGLESHASSFCIGAAEPG